MGRIEADIALESWLFGFQPCSGQGQFTLLSLFKVRWPFKLGKNQLSGHFHNIMGLTFFSFPAQSKMGKYLLPLN